MDHKTPKVLVFSHNPISYQTGNGKTLAAFFSTWPASNIAQIYTSKLSLDFSICGNYFYIDEVKLITTVFWKQYYGSPVYSCTPSIEKDNELNYTKSRLHYVIAKFIHTGLGRLVREFIWKRKFTENIVFTSWIETFNPDVILLTLGELAAEYDFIDKLSSKYNIPIILYASDDYLCFDRIGIFYIFQKIMLKKAYENIKLRSPLLIAICDAMAKRFREQYGFYNKIIVAMNSCNYEDIADEATLPSSPVHLLYTGNLELGRWKVLETIADVLPRISDVECYLDIYSSFRITNRLKKRLEKSGKAFFRGNAPHDELHSIRESSDILVFVESFDNKYKNILSTAMSTKIPEYLSSGKIILAIGPSYSASISYLEENHAGYCLTELSSTAIHNIICKIVQADISSNRNIIKNALQLAHKRHNKSNNADEIFSSIVYICEKD